MTEHDDLTLRTYCRFDRSFVFGCAVMAGLLAAGSPVLALIAAGVLVVMNALGPPLYRNKGKR